MPYKFILAIIFLAVLQAAKADTIQTTIYGKHNEYANQVIKVYRYSDYITQTKQLLAIDTADQNGNFNLSFMLSETLQINIPLGIYSMVLYTEPGKTYEVVLPPNQPLQKHDILNPFFKPVEMYLGIKNADSLEINYMIAEYNEMLSNYIDSNYYYIFRNPQSANVDSVIHKIELRYSNYNNLFFKDYRTYKYAWVKYISYMRDYRYVIKEYYHNKPFLCQNPAYMDLFNQIFANYLSLYMNRKEGERLYSDIAMAKSPTFAKQTFSNNMVLINDTLQEFVLLKGLNDAFSTKDFPIQSLIMTLDSVENTTKIEEHKVMAENIKKKALVARVGYPAAKFELRDANGVFRHSNEFLANYTYVNFFSAESFACQQDLVTLKSVYEKHKTDFKIVSICIDEDFNAAIDYFKNKGYEWMLLSYRTQKTILDDYKVRSYPSYYLIDPNGLLRLSPALSPGENFELQFFRLLQTDKRKQKY